jgi:hypothetical protein
MVGPSVILVLQKMNLENENSAQMNLQEQSEFWTGAPINWEDLDDEEIVIQRGKKG